jgi:hypothetical protein
MITGVDRRAATRALAQAALMPAAAFAVHQLRFMLAFRGTAGVQLERQGHAYLHSLVPWIALLLAVAAGLFAWAVGRALAGQTSLPRYTISLAGLWLVCAGLLLGIFVVQELLEGMFASGHPVGLAGVFGHGGWWAIPLSLSIGLVVAAVLHGARWMVRSVAARRARRCARPVARVLAVLRPRDFRLPAFAPLVGGWSGRGPPHPLTR